MLARPSRSRSRTIDSPSKKKLLKPKSNPPAFASASKPPMAAPNALEVLAVAANEVKQDFDTAHSSSLSELEDDELSDPPQDPIQPQLLDVDSETETERLHISPQKNGLDDNEDDQTTPKQRDGDTHTRFQNERGSLGKRKRLQPISDNILAIHMDDDDEPTPKRALTEDVQMEIEEQLAASIAERDANGDDTAQEDAEPPTSSKKLKGKGRKRGGKVSLLASTEVETTVEPSDVDNLDDEVEEEVVEEEEEEEDEEGTSPDEELAKRKVAASELAEIEKDFIAFRARLVVEQLEQVEHELELLKNSDSQHADYLAQQQCIDHRRDQKLLYEDRLLEHSLKNLATRIVGERQQVHSQYFQEIRQIRSDALSSAYREYYALQRDRWRHGLTNQSLPLYNPDRATQIAKQSSYNLEASILSGIAQYVGFPSAPEITSLSSDDISSDMQQMGISPELRASSASRRPTQPPNPAEEQFLEQTPWANPQHPAHASASVQSFHTQTSHFVTPAVQTRKTEIPTSYGSQSTVEMTANSTGPAPDNADSPSLLKVNKMRNAQNGVRIFQSPPPTNKNAPEIIGPTPQRTIIAASIANAS